MRRSTVLALIVAAFLCGGCGLSASSLGRAYQAQQEYDNKLRAAGVEASLPGVEAYIKSVVQPGTSRTTMLERLALVGVIGHSGANSPICEDVRIFLSHRPGDTFPLYLAPSTPPVYNINVCYSGGSVSQVGNLNRVDESNQ